MGREMVIYRSLLMVAVADELMQASNLLTKTLQARKAKSVPIAFVVHDAFEQASRHLATQSQRSHVSQPVTDFLARHASTSPGAQISSASCPSSSPLVAGI